MRGAAMDYDKQFDEMYAKLKTNPSKLQAFLSNPQPVLEAAGIPLVEASVAGRETSPKMGMAAAAATAQRKYKLDVKKHWWGLDFVMNEDLTQAVATGAIVGPPLVALITSSFAVAGIVTGPVAGVIAAGFALGFGIKIVQIKLTDKGKGVRWPVTWVQWGTLAAAVPGGPATVLGAMILFLHPLPR
jgi:hypothetical protein